MTFDAVTVDVPAVRSIRELAAQRSGAADLAAFTTHAREVAQASHAALLAEFERQDDPLMLWVVHREAQARGFPPCLRWGSLTRDTVVSRCSDLSSTNLADDQRLFVNWLADVLWWMCRDATWRPAETRWLPLFESAANSADWHAHAVGVFDEGVRHPTSFAARLGLTTRMSSATLTMISPALHADRSSLADLDELRRRLVAYALRRPDRSGTYTPDQVVERRLLAHRVFIFADRRHGLAAQYLGLLTGQAVSRQAFTRQLEAIAAASDGMGGEPVNDGGSSLSAKS